MVSGGNTVNNSFAAGMVRGEFLTGGLVGSLEGDAQVSSSYWNTQTSGQSTSAGGTGNTTDEMTYPYADDAYNDWNFDNIWAADFDYTQNGGYPYLADNPVPNTDDGNIQKPVVNLGNYPNPFNPDTNISFILPKAMNVSLTIYNLKGQKVNTLIKDHFYSAGDHYLSCMVNLTQAQQFLVEFICILSGERVSAKNVE
jgi:hypothetical protein